MNLSDISAGSSESLSQELQQMTGRINTVWGKEHNADGTHKIPCWVNPTPGSSDFASVSGQTWAVVVATMVVTWAYWKHGTSITVAFEIFNTTIAGTPANHLTMKIPGGFKAKHKTRNMIYLTDNGARIDGMAVVEAETAAGTTTIDVYRADVANFTGGNTDVRGQLSFETTA